MDPLLDLIDHPPRDPEPPRNPVFTAQVMERIRPRPQPQRYHRSSLPWLAAAVLILGLALQPDLGSLEAWFNTDLAIDPLWLIDLAIGILFTLPFLLQRRKHA